MPQCSWPQTLHVPLLSLLNPNLPLHFHISLTALFLVEFLLSLQMTANSYCIAKDAQSTFTFTNKTLKRQLTFLLLQLASEVFFKYPSVQGLVPSQSAVEK